MRSRSMRPRYYQGWFVSNPLKVRTDERSSMNTYGAGIQCEWTSEMSKSRSKKNQIDFRWDFDWSELKSEGVDSLSGELLVTHSRNTVMFQKRRIPVNWNKGNETICTSLNTKFSEVCAIFKYRLNPHYGRKKKNPIHHHHAENLEPPLAENDYVAPPETEPHPYDKMFAPSAAKDAIVVVEGRKLYVNKPFLSFHSNFFGSLFSSQPDVRVGELPEFPIDGISYEDFGFLMSTIYPVIPNDDVAKKLLQLNRRFEMPSVALHVEDHLLQSDSFSNEKLMSMADTHGLGYLFQQTIRSMDSKAKIRDLQKHPEYQSLSSEAKSMICDRIMEII